MFSCEPRSVSNFSTAKISSIAVGHAITRRAEGLYVTLEAGDGENAYPGG